MEPYKLVVMFFGMTNSPATFQGMMNEILRDMINEEKVATFMDDILVGIKTEKEHDELVEEVLRWLKRKRPLCETREMYLKDAESKLPGSNNGSEED